MRAWIMLVAPLTIAVALCAARLASSQPAANQPPIISTIALPITELVLYSNGLAHFKRERDVDGNARIELTAQAGEMNDMLKSLVVDDNATAPAIVYDSPDTIEQSLPTSALNVIGNPALGDLLHQSRGENVEIAMTGGTGDLTGLILGMEERTDPARSDAKIDLLNLWTDAGIRGVQLKDIRSVRFVNAKLDAEVRRALAQLAANRDARLKLMRLNLSGAGRRRVGISYVAEAPVWKASYRLTVGAGGATRLQGWAMVENTTNEDWNDVKLTLAGSRPVSFQMDLYPPLFVPRPIVEPSQFAALRPPTYLGPYQTNLGFGGMHGAGGFQGGGLGFAGGNQGSLGLAGGNFRSFGGGLGGGTGGSGGTTNNRYSQSNGQPRNEEDQPLTYDKYKKRLRERRGTNDTNDAPIRDALEIAADPLGEPARYAVAGTVSIPRMKSALVPFFSQSITPSVVSVFSPEVHSTRALHAFRIKNTTGHPLTGGPVTVANLQGYAGDARLTEWPANEDRFVAYAIDLGCECRVAEQATRVEITGAKINRGRIEESRLHRSRTLYGFRHHGGPDRTVWVERPTTVGWKLVNPAEAAERTLNGLRFKVDLTAGKTANLEVALEHTDIATRQITDINSADLRTLAALPVINPNVKQAIHDVVQLRERSTQATNRIADLRAVYAEANEEQARLRRNLEKVPVGDALHKQLLEKLSKQESVIEASRQQIVTTSAEEMALQTELQSKSTTMTIE